MGFPTSSMDELSNKCRKKAAAFLRSRSRWMCSSTMGVFWGRRTIPSSSHPEFNHSFPSPCALGAWLRCHSPSGITRSAPASTKQNPRFCGIHNIKSFSSLLQAIHKLHRGKGREQLLDRLRWGLSSQSTPNCLSLFNFFHLEINLQVSRSFSQFGNPEGSLFSSQKSHNFLSGGTSFKITHSEAHLHQLFWTYTKRHNQSKLRRCTATTPCTSPHQHCSLAGLATATTDFSLTFQTDTVTLTPHQSTYSGLLNTHHVPPQKQQHFNQSRGQRPSQ